LSKPVILAGFFGLLIVQRVDIKGETEMSKMIDLENHYTVEEVAALLNTNVDAIRKHYQRNTIKIVRFGKSILISKEEVEEFRKKRRGRGRPTN
jgi:excisionase family DNA binding protein